jgi:hypothetical protein
MHTCQILLVEAETPEQAFDEVARKLEGEPKWSDWHNADQSGAITLNFAGRWSGEVFGSYNEEGVMTNTDTNPNYLRYSDDPALAEQVITRFLEYRYEEIRLLQPQALDLSSYSYDPYNNKLDMELWGTKKLAQLLNDDWTPDSGIYDLDYWTGSLDNFTKRVASSPEKQFLIPVDFHF